MTEQLSNSYTSFDGFRRIAAGSLAANALVVKNALNDSTAGPVLIFDDATGRAIDVDMSGSDQEMIARLGQAAFKGGDRESSESRPSSDLAIEPVGTGPRSRGRPKLGVIAREVTLLPRHWEWLAQQSGGASVALRKLVEDARRANRDKDRIRESQERAYHFMSAIAGNLPGFEEATRALFANDPIAFGQCIGQWPDNVREHAKRLAFGDGSDLT